MRDVPAFLYLFFTFLIFSCFQMAMPQNVLAQTSQSSKPNMITMPWSDFQKLWKSSQEDPVERLSQYAYGKALYEANTQVSGEDYLIHFKLSVDVQTYEDKSHLIPFLSEELNLEKLFVNGQAATWILESGFYQVPIGQKGIHRLEARFTLKINQDQWPRSLRLPLAPMPQNELRMLVPDQEIEAQISQGVTTATIPASSGSSIQAFFPATNHLDIKWLKKASGQQELDLKMDAQVSSYVSLEEAGAELQSEIKFRILQGQSNVFQVKLPQFLDVIDVTTPEAENGISQWYTEEQENHKLIHIYSAYQQKERFIIRIKLEHTTNQSSYQFAVPNILPQKVDRFDREVAVGSKNNVELKEAKIKGAERLDVRFLPQSLQNFSGNQALFYYRVLDSDSALEFQVKSHEQVKLLKTRIDRVEATSVLADSGMVMTKATFLVKNNQAQFLRFQLPPQAHLLSVFLQGREIQPSLDKKGMLLLPIVKSVSSSFPVEIAFLTQKSSFFWLGSNSLELVQSDLPIGELQWEVYVPEDYQAIYFGGNVRAQSYSSFQKFKNLIRQLVYHESAVPALAGGKSYQFNSMGLRKRFKADKAKSAYGESVSRDSIQKELSRRQIQVDIPVSGQVYRFNSYLLKDKVPYLSFLYINQSIQYVIHLLISLIVAIGVFVSLAFIFERISIPQKFRSKGFYLKLVLFYGGFLSGLAIFSFDAMASIIHGAWLAFFVFVLWQNRQRAKQFRQQVQHRALKYIPEVLLVFSLPILAIALMIQVSWVIVMSHLALITFYCFVFRMLPWFFVRFNRLTRSKATAASLMILALGFGVLSVENRVFAGEESASDMIDPSSKVDMDWEFIQKLIHQKDLLDKTRSQRLNIDYVFGNAEISGKIMEKQAHLNIVVPLKILAQKYVKVPLFSESVSISEAKLSGQDLLLNYDGSGVYFETRAENSAQQNLELSLVLPLKEKGGVWELNLGAKFLHGASLSLFTGDEVESSTVFDAIWQDQQAGKLSAVLSNNEELKVELATFKREDVETTHLQGVKKRYANTYTLASLENNVATFYSSIRYEILNDQVRDFMIRLPENVVVHEIIGEDLEEWRKIKTEKGMSTYQARALYPASKRYDLSVKYEVLLKKDQKNFELPNLEVLRVARNIGFVGIETQSNTEMHLKKLESARMIDIRELPHIISGDAQSPLVYALRYVEQPFQASFTLNKHKNLALDPAIADRVDYTYVVSPEGHIQAEAKIFLRNSQKQFVHLSLPKGAKLLSAYLDNQSIKPTHGEKGSILLPLKRQSNRQFVLEIVFEYAGSHLNGIAGISHIKFPKLDIPVSLVTSQFYLPEDLVFSEPWGDFKNIQVRGYVSWYENKVGSESTPEPANDAVSFNRVIENKSPVASGLRVNSAENDAQIMPSQKNEEMREGRQDRFAGTLPLKIKLPKKGKAMSSNVFYIDPGQELEASFVYGHQTIHLFIELILALAIFVLGFFLASWKKLPKVLNIAIVTSLLVLKVFVFANQAYFWILLIIGFALAILKNKLPYWKKAAV